LSISPPHLVLDDTHESNRLKYLWSDTKTDEKSNTVLHSRRRSHTTENRVRSRRNWYYYRTTVLSSLAWHFPAADNGRPLLSSSSRVACIVLLYARVYLFFVFNRTYTGNKSVMGNEFRERFQKSRKPWPDKKNAGLKIKDDRAVGDVRTRVCVWRERKRKRERDGVIKKISAHERYINILCSRTEETIFVLFSSFISKQISTVTITDRFSLTTHVVDSFMAVPKIGRPSCTFSRVHRVSSYPPYTHVVSRTGTTFDTYNRRGTRVSDDCARPNPENARSSLVLFRVPGANNRR